MTASLGLTKRMLDLTVSFAEHYEQELETTTDNDVWRTTCRIKAQAFRELEHALKTGESILDYEVKRS